MLAGTQGARNHKKQDRLFALAEKQRLPVVLFAEGGGGRPGDTEGLGVTGLDVPTFAQFASLSGLAPLVGVVSGRCFAGNAALLGCCDVVIATKDSSIGMGGPAMIEGGGLGMVRPDDVGPVSMQARTASSTSWSRTRSRPPPRRRPISRISRDRPLPRPRPIRDACAPRSRRTGCASTTSARWSRRLPTTTASEVVELFGVDDGPLNTRDEVIRFGTASFATATIRANGQESDERAHTRDDVQLRQLNEDRPGRDEIRAVVTLKSGTITVTRASNLVLDDYNPAHA